MLQYKIGKTDGILVKARKKFPFYPTYLNVSMDIFDFNQLCMKPFSQKPNEEHFKLNLNQAPKAITQIPSRPSHRRCTHHIDTAEKNADRFFRSSFTHSQLVVKKCCDQKRHTKRITNLNLNHMSLFSVPCVHMKLKKPSSSECTFFHRRSFSPLLPLASVQLPIYGRK